METRPRHRVNNRKFDVELMCCSSLFKKFLVTFKNTLKYLLCTTTIQHRDAVAFGIKAA